MPMKSRVVLPVIAGLVFVTVVMVLVWPVLLTPVTDEALRQACRNNLRQIERAVREYVQRWGALPDSVYRCEELQRASRDLPRLLHCPGLTHGDLPKPYVFWNDLGSPPASVLAGDSPLVQDADGRHRLSVYLGGAIRKDGD
jgi:hypothetical protein